MQQVLFDLAIFLFLTYPMKENEICKAQITPISFTPRNYQVWVHDSFGV